MTTASEKKGAKTLSGIIRGAIPGSLLTTGILLSYGYVSGIIYSIGDTRQLIPVFTGIIIGAIVFSLIGFILRPTQINIISLTIFSLVLLIAAYVIISLNSLVLNSTNMMIVAFLMGSPAMAVSQLVGDSSAHYSFIKRVIFGSVQAVLVIVFIFVFSLEYEMQGQVNLYSGPLLFLALSLAYLIVLKTV
jgi:hypothetical protein